MKLVTFAKARYGSSSLLAANSSAPASLLGDQPSGFGA
jgi:hypothetical protein